MWILLLEASGALFMLLFMVWWTMFSGRGPERHKRRQAPERKDDDTPAP